MKNEEKAKKLAEEHENATSFGIESPYHAALGAAIDMAEWKDRQLRQILDDIRSEAERCIFTCIAVECDMDCAQDIREKWSFKKKAYQHIVDYINQIKI